MSAYQDTVEEASSELRALWRALNVAPLWEAPSGAPGSAAREAAHIWRWSEAMPMLLDTAKISSPRVVERRVMVLVNPASAAVGKDATAGLLTGSLQTLLPGETARPHRHTMDALRFILEGEGAETIVDGKPCKMTPGDLILTPGWTWHEHVHGGPTPVIWLDILNVMLHEAFGTTRFQPGPVREPPPQYDDTMFTAANMLPVMGWHDRPYSPVFRYPWAQAVEAVKVAPAARDGSRRARYANPTTGGACMALIDCGVLQLPPSVETIAFRSSASTICSVVEGVGVSTFDGGKQVDWAPRDTFTVPANQTVVHRAGSSGARLFIASDRAAYERLGLLQEEFVG